MPTGMPTAASATDAQRRRVQPQELPLASLGMPDLELPPPAIPLDAEPVVDVGNNSLLKEAESILHLLCRKGAVRAIETEACEVNFGSKDNCYLDRKGLRPFGAPHEPSLLKDMGASLLVDGAVDKDNQSMSPRPKAAAVWADVQCIPVDTRDAKAT